MNVLLISQCNKRALTETRRILDQFAERRGERTWQTAITQAGLDTLRKLLRRTARKNTAVACHWIRGMNHSEVLWIVGDAKQFNAEGAVPTNTTIRDVLRREDENSWHSLTIMRQLTALAALLHDLGKACAAFQARLSGGMPHEKNRYRHEWISVRLFQAFVGQDNDEAWLQRLVEGAGEGVEASAYEALWKDHAGGRLLRDGLDPAANQDTPFALSGLPPLAQAVAWLVFTHHRLPALPRSSTESGETKLWHGRQLSRVNGAELTGVIHRMNADWNEPWMQESAPMSRPDIEPYWTFDHGLPVSTPLWRKRAARIAQSLLKNLQAGREGWQDPFVMHMSRLALMLADHHYSSLKEKTQRVQGAKDYPLFANTDRQTGVRLQPLDEHLLGVELHASQLVHALPSFSAQLPHLTRHRGLRQRSKNPLFQWQDKAADLAAGVRQRAADQGVFIVNMASTGCGKTLGNARIMNALADPVRGMRCAFAIGLRTLTLQTGRSFQQTLGLGEDELAIQVGGTASRELFEYYERLAEQTGSASSRDLLDETSHVVFEGNDQHPVMSHLERDANARRMLAAPMLVCTVDHLIPATESLRGGHQIVPMLRLLSGDLVLDEPDDFDLADLPALTRLVHWAGLLGARVLLSSATLPPALIEGLFLSYREGRRWFQKNRGQRPGEVPDICCLWVDEFSQEHADCAEAEGFQERHLSFARKREEKLSAQAVRRRAELLRLPRELRSLDQSERRTRFAAVLRDAALALHGHHHSVDPHSGKRVSFGLIRVANIDPLFDVALALFRRGAPEGVQIHLCVYHSQYPLFIRSAIEHRLDTALNRRDENAVFDLPEIRQALDSGAAPDQLFIVLGSPVTEVGRDHDYDWAVVEPSSMRSLIQLAGRVLRHRQHTVVAYPNLLICDTNLRHFDRPDKPAFYRPGFESEGFPLQSHSLEVLLAPWLDEQGRMPIDARPRILPRPISERTPDGNLVDLEHARMEWQMLVPQVPKVPARRNRLASQKIEQGALTALNASSFWQCEQASMTGFLQQAQPFREDARPDVDVVLLPDDDGENYALCRVAEGERKWQELFVRVDGSLNHRLDDAMVRGAGTKPWGCWDLMQTMVAQAEDMALPLKEFAEKYARASLPQNNQGWRWHPALGFSQKK